MPDPAQLTTRQRHRELVRILAAGLLRHRRLLATKHRPEFLQNRPPDGLMFREKPCSVSL